MIEVANLYKSYRERVVVNDLSFTVAPGEVFALLGPNGAGKSTTIKMLTTLTRPDRGRIIIAGHDAGRRPELVRPLIALVPQESNLDRELSVRENLEIYARMYRLDDIPGRISRTLERFALAEDGNRLVDQLSCGVRRRVLIARALLANPRVLFMDEPSIGLDPGVRRDIWKIIVAVRDSGVTVLLTTHYMEEAETLCSRIGIMIQGQLQLADTAAELCRRVGVSRLEEVFLSLTGEEIKDGGPHDH